MVPKEISINVLGVDLSTKNIPKQGIKLSELDDDAQGMLAVFDTHDKNGKKVAKGDGYLSAAELRGAISLFAKYDTYHKNPAYEPYIGKGELKELGKRYLDKDGFIDRYEAENMRDFICKRYNDIGNNYGISEYDSTSSSTMVQQLAECLCDAMSGKLRKK